MTSDMEIPELWHGLLKIIKGAKGDFKNTFRIHKHVIEPVQQHVAHVREDELLQLTTYTEAIEMQAVGQMKMYPVRLPNLRSLEQHFKLESVS